MENGNIDALAEAMEQFVKIPLLFNRWEGREQKSLSPLNRQIQIPLIADLFK